MYIYNLIVFYALFFLTYLDTFIIQIKKIPWYPSLGGEVDECVVKYMVHGDLGPAPGGEHL